MFRETALIGFIQYAQTCDDISSGKDPEKLNSDLEAAIRQVCYLKEQAIITAMSAYQSRQESHCNHRTICYCKAI